MNIQSSVVFIQTLQIDNPKFSNQMENLGVGYISSYLLKKGIDSKIYYTSFENDFSDTIKRIISDNPAIIGLPLITYYYHESVREIAKDIKQLGYNGKIVVGGHSASFFPEIILHDDNIDFVICGFGESSMYQLYNWLVYKLSSIDKIEGLCYRLDGNFIQNKVNKELCLNLLSAPDRGYLDYYPDLTRRTLFSISASRGCSGTCKFCSIGVFYRNFSDKQIQSRSVTDIINELVYLEKNGVKHVVFVDDEIFLGFLETRVKVIEFIDEYQRNKLSIKYAISCRVDSVDLHNLKMLQNNGLEHLFLGVEFFTRDELKFYSKILDPEISLKTIQLIRKSGFSLQCGFLMFHPYATVDSINQNMKSLREIGEIKFNILCNIMEPYYGTKLREVLIKDSLIKYIGVKPSIKFKSLHVDSLWGFISRLSELFFDLILIYFKVGDCITLEWRDKTLFPSWNVDYGQIIDNWYRDVNQFFFNQFEMAVRFMNDNMSNEEVLSGFEEWSKNELLKNNEEYIKHMMTINILCKAKKDYT